MMWRRLSRIRIALLREIDHLKEGVSDAESHNLVKAHRQYFTRSIPTGNFIAFVAVTDGVIVSNGGLVFVDRPPYVGNLEGRDAYVMNMYTTREWRNRGVASRLLSLMVQCAREAGVRRVWLHAEPLARKIYERAGFVPKDSAMELVL